MGRVSKGDRKDGRKGTVPGSDIKFGGTVCAIIWQRDLGGEQGDAQVPDRVPLSGGVIDHGGNGKIRGRRIVGVPISREGGGSRGVPFHWGLHQEAVDEHSGESGLPSRLCTVHGSGADAGHEPVILMVGPRLVK